MSPTHKPKPPDKGAPPEHKPSRKVALEEVMRSLQDLVSNELAIEPAKPAAEAQASTAKTKKKTAPAEKPPAARSAFSADVLPTMPPGAAEPTAEPESIARDRVLPTQSVSAVPGVVDELPDLGAEPQTTLAGPPPGTASEVPLGGLQQELPYLEAAPPAPTVNLPAPTPETSEAEPSSLLPEMLPTDEPNTDIIDAGNNIQASDVEEINLDDFPVLEEVVDIDSDELGHRTDPGSVLAAMEFVPSPANLPPADAAHRLAIQVAARLNVELRKSGQGGLSSDIITRLARLLQEALAKGASNMENSPPDKH
jgi:hypothetical protein